MVIIHEQTETLNIKIYDPMNQREIIFRGLTASNEWVEGDLFSSTSGKNTTYFILPKGSSYFDEYEQVKPESIGQFCGLHDKHGKRIFEGMKISFWVCYPTTQTHTGDNIPNGSYTEPDETQFMKIEAEVIWDNDNLKYSFSIIGDRPYQFHQYNRMFWDESEYLPIIGRPPYSLEYIKEFYGYDGIEQGEWQEYLNDVGFSSESEMMKAINEIEIIETPELLQP